MAESFNRVAIRVDSSLSRFRPEIDYAFAVIGRWSGLVFRRVEDSCSGAVDIDYGPHSRGGAIWIRESFFSQGCSVGLDGVKLKPGWKKLVGDIPRYSSFMGVQFAPLFSSDPSGLGVRTPSESGQSWEILHDLIGVVFFLISRIEELVEDGRDHYGRFCAQQTLAYQCGFLERPEADRQVQLLSHILFACGRVGSLTGSMRIYLTHDVDRLKAYHGLGALARESIGNVIRKRSGPLVALAQACRQLSSGEPFRSIRWLMDRAEECGVSSRFFFMAGTRHPIDADYAYRWRNLMSRVAKEIQVRGHMVGFHPGFETWKDEETWLKQKVSLEDILETQVLEGRQHVLRFHPHTWEIWEKAGMQRDYGLSFPYGVAYRAGTTRAYPAYGLRARQSFRLEVVPTSVMEFALFMNKYVDLSRETAMQRVKAAVVEHRYYRGDLAVLFHPITIMSLQDEYREVLSEIFQQPEQCHARFS